MRYVSVYRAENGCVHGLNCQIAQRRNGVIMLLSFFAPQPKRSDYGKQSNKHEMIKHTNVYLLQKIADKQGPRAKEIIQDAIHELCELRDTMRKINAAALDAIFLGGLALMALGIVVAVVTEFWLSRGK